MVVVKVENKQLSRKVAELSLTCCHPPGSLSSLCCCVRDCASLQVRSRACVRPSGGEVCHHSSSCVQACACVHMRTALCMCVRCACVVHVRALYIA
jgi:hypothetical protein